MVAPSIIVWNILLERNSRIFKMKPSSLQEVLTKIKVLISEFVLSYVYKNLDFIISFSQ